MSDWHVSGSESDGEVVDDGAVELGNLRIPPHRVAELLRTIETRKTLDLECLAGAAAGASQSRRERRRRHKRRKRNSEASPGSKQQEEVSETASELRSTASTETREGKWNNVSHFDYFHEEGPAQSDISLHKKHRKQPPGNREKKLASLDQIVADVKQQKEKQQLTDLSSTTPEISLPYNHHPLRPSFHTSSSPATTLPVSNLFDFDEGSDQDSPTGSDNIKTSVLSQINRVEKLLDDEGLT